MHPAFPPDGERFAAAMSALCLFWYALAGRETWFRRRAARCSIVRLDDIHLNIHSER